jgi:amidase
VAFTTEPMFGRSTSPECRAAIHDAARLLEELGHEVVEARPAFSREALVHAFLVVLSASVAEDVATAARATGRRPGPDTLEPETWALAAGGEALTALDLALAQQEAHRAARGIAEFFVAHDVLVTPTMAQPPLPLGALASKPIEKIGLRAVARLRSRALLDRLFVEIGARTFEATGNTMIWNQTGQPAMSVPLHVTGRGLPVGVQFTARFGDEATLFRLAAQLEAARPWAERAPPGG